MRLRPTAGSPRHEHAAHSVRPDASETGPVLRPPPASLSIWQPQALVQPEVQQPAQGPGDEGRQGHRRLLEHGRRRDLGEKSGRRASCRLRVRAGPRGGCPIDSAVHQASVEQTKALGHRAFSQAGEGFQGQGGGAGRRARIPSRPNLSKRPLSSSSEPNWMETSPCSPAEVRL